MSTCTGPTKPSHVGFGGNFCDFISVKDANEAMIRVVVNVVVWSLEGKSVLHCADI